MLHHKNALHSLLSSAASRTRTQSYSPLTFPIFLFFVLFLGGGGCEGRGGALSTCFITVTGSSGVRMSQMLSCIQRRHHRATWQPHDRGEDPGTISSHNQDNQDRLRGVNIFKKAKVRGPPGEPTVLCDPTWPVREELQESGKYANQKQKAEIQHFLPLVEWFMLCGSVPPHPLPHPLCLLTVCFSCVVWAISLGGPTLRRALCPTCLKRRPRVFSMSQKLLGPIFPKNNQTGNFQEDVRSCWLVLITKLCLFHFHIPKMKHSHEKALKITQQDSRFGFSHVKTRVFVWFYYNILIKREITFYYTQFWSKTH